MFEWDERKRLSNLAKHGVDFNDARLIFAGNVLEVPDTKRDYGELRTGALGVVGVDVFYVIYTWRGDKRRLISARKANSRERKACYEILKASKSEQEN